MSFRIRRAVRRADRRAALACVLGIVALGGLLPVLAAPRAEAAECRTGVTGEELPEGADAHPLIDQLGLRQAWDLATGEGVTVAVIDSGVDARHPELHGRVARGSEFTTVYDEREFTESNPEHQRDCEGHGTAVAGLIAARGPDDRVVGVAPDATIYPVRIDDEVGEASDRMLAAAIEDAIAAEVDVINLSLNDRNDHEPIREAIEHALDEDIVVVAATGNEGNEDTKMYPAAYDGVLAVGAVGFSGEPMGESNAGPWVDLAGIGDPVPLVAPGGEGYREDGGTSFAAAQVSGAAALVLDRFPGLTAEQVAERLTGSATPLGGGVNDRTGSGLVDPFSALTYLAGPDDAGEDDVSPGHIPLRAMPEEEPLLGSTAATALAVSGGLLLLVLLVLLAAPAVRRASGRDWRPGTVNDAPDPPRATAESPQPSAARLTWLDGAPSTPSHRSRTP
jgi:membrane-anchored mycosin MYCP